MDQSIIDLLTHTHTHSQISLLDERRLLLLLVVARRKRTRGRRGGQRRRKTMMRKEKGREGEAGGRGGKARTYIVGVGVLLPPAQQSKGKAAEGSE